MATIKEVQKLTGLLNFLNRAIVPGRVFTRRMYAKIQTTNAQGRKLKSHHHVTVDKEFKKDMHIWELFLEQAGASALCRPFLDRNMFITSKQICFYTDASGKIGYGCFFNGKWAFEEWDQVFLRKAKPSIEYLELFALTVGILTWADLLVNTRIVIFCDNQAVVHMVNNTMSGCKNCMFLLRLLVLNCLQHNRRISVKYMETSKNVLADSLSCLKLGLFWSNAPENTEMKPYTGPEELWPIQKHWHLN